MAGTKKVKTEEERKENNRAAAKKTRDEKKRKNAQAMELLDTLRSDPDATKFKDTIEVVIALIKPGPSGTKKGKRRDGAAAAAAAEPRPAKKAKSSEQDERTPMDEDKRTPMDEDKTPPPPMEEDPWSLISGGAAAAAPASSSGLDFTVERPTFPAMFRLYVQRKRLNFTPISLATSCSS